MDAWSKKFLGGDDKSIEGVESSSVSCSEFVGRTIAPVSISAVIREVSSIPTRKGEYETTADFDARRSAATKRIRESYLVSTPVDPAYLTYDADAQMLWVLSYAIDNQNAGYEEVFGYGTPLDGQVPYSRVWNIDIVPVSTETRSGKHLASNAFGVTTTAYRVKRTKVALFERAASMDHDSLFALPVRVSKTGGDTIAGIPASTTVARDLKKTLKAAVLFEPKAPFYASGETDWGPPTLDAPDDIDESVQVVVADIQCVLIADGANKVLAAVQTK